MKKRTLIILASAVAISTGMGAGTFAWFTGQARSTGNEFKVGILGISASTYGWAQAEENQQPGTINLNNMKPGDERSYKFTVSNRIDDRSISTLDLKYNTRIVGDNYGNSENSLLKVARFDVAIDGHNPNLKDERKHADLSFMELQDYLAIERRLPGTGATEIKDEYTIRIKLPGEATGNEYQGRTAVFTFETNAIQDTAPSLVSK